MDKTGAAEPSSAGKADQQPLTVGAVLFTFVFTTLIHEPASIVTLLAILAISVGLDYGWKRSRPHHPLEVPVGH